MIGRQEWEKGKKNVSGFEKFLIILLIIFSLFVFVAAYWLSHVDN